MNPEWFTAVMAALGIVGQLAIGQRNAGKRDEKMHEHDRKLSALERDVRSHDRLLTKHNSRLATISSKCKVLFGPAKWGNGETGGEG